jgi:hypothetical protein
MVDVDTLLKEGAERRERAANRCALLDELRRGTRRSIWTALPCLLVSGFYFWRLGTEFMSDAPMTKSDVVSFLSYVLMCGLMLYLGVSALQVNRRDLFLIELLEEKIQNEK